MKAIKIPSTPTLGRKKGSRSSPTWKAIPPLHLLENRKNKGKKKGGVQRNHHRMKRLSRWDQVLFHVHRNKGEKNRDLNAERSLPLAPG